MPSTKTHLLSEPGHVSRHAEKILSAPALGVDTEFVRERTYFPRPGLFQFSDGNQAWLVDPVALAGQDCLQSLVGTIMADTATTKILHSVGEDLEVIDLVAQKRPQPLFDTQRAAALLGWPLQIRYELLAGELLGVELPGGLGRNDWCRRPLPDPWVEYAANDVIALPDMREALAERLDRAGRSEWLQEDCCRILKRRNEDTNPLVRIKGAAGLSDIALERLDRLAQWRETQARQRDLPRGFVVSDPVLLELTRLASPDERALNRLDTGRQRLGERDRAALVTVLQAGPGDFERPPELTPLTREQRAEIKAMQGRVRNTAEALGVEPAVIASRRDLTRKVLGLPCPWLDGWRGELLKNL